MAYISNDYCYTCCKNTTHCNGKCGVCKEQAAEKHHREHFALLDSMTLEERVRRLEKIDYDNFTNPPWIEPTY